MKLTNYRPRTNYNNQGFKPNEILQDYKLSKFFFILHCKLYVFDWELKKKFNFTQNEIQKYSMLLEQWGYITYKLLGDLDLNWIETILKTTPDAEKIYKQNPKVYTITSTGRKEGREVVLQVAKDAQTHETLYNFMLELQTNYNSVLKLLASIQKEEKNSIKRTVSIPGYPLKIEILTKCVKEALKEISKKSASTQLKGQNKTSLVVTNEFNKKNVLELTQHDERVIFSQNNGISEKEYKIIQTEIKEETKQRVKDLYQETSHFKNKDHLLEHRPFQETTGKYFLGNPEPIEEGLQFLEGLKMSTINNNNLYK